MRGGVEVYSSIIGTGLHARRAGRGLLCGAMPSVRRELEPEIQRNLNAHGTLTFFRDAHGLEVDLLVERGRDLLAIEAKSGQTVAPDALAPLDALTQLLPEKIERVVAHGGSEAFTLHDTRIVPYHQLDSLDWGEQSRPRKRAARPGGARKRTAKR